MKKYFLLIVLMINKAGIAFDVQLDATLSEEDLFNIFFEGSEEGVGALPPVGKDPESIAPPPLADPSKVAEAAEDALSFEGLAATAAESLKLDSYLGEKFSCSCGFYNSQNAANVKRHITTKHKGLEGFKIIESGIIKPPKKKQKTGIDYRCSHCSEPDYSDGIAEHILTHANKNSANTRWICPECPELITERRKLLVHIRRAHTKEKPYKCDTPNCSKAFAYKGELTYHQNRHKNIKKFSCLKCGCEFVTSTELNSHKKSHSKERHSCSYCGRSWKSKYILNDHIKTVHGDKD